MLPHIQPQDQPSSQVLSDASSELAGMDDVTIEECDRVEVEELTMIEETTPGSLVVEAKENTQFHPLVPRCALIKGRCIRGDIALPQRDSVGDIDGPSRSQRRVRSPTFPRQQHATHLVSSAGQCFQGDLQRTDSKFYLLPGGTYIGAELYFEITPQCHDDNEERKTIHSDEMGSRSSNASQQTDDVAELHPPLRKSSEDQQHPLRSNLCHQKQQFDETGLRMSSILLRQRTVEEILQCQDQLIAALYRQLQQFSHQQQQTQFVLQQQQQHSEILQQQIAQMSELVAQLDQERQQRTVGQQPPHPSQTMQTGPEVHLQRPRQLEREDRGLQPKCRTKCRCCGRSHEGRDCYFLGAKCAHCNEVGHIRPVCPVAMKEKEKADNKGKGDRKKKDTYISRAVATAAVLACNFSGNAALSIPHTFCTPLGGPSFYDTPCTVSGGLSAFASSDFTASSFVLNETLGVQSRGLSDFADIAGADKEYFQSALLNDPEVSMKHAPNAATNTLAGSRGLEQFALANATAFSRGLLPHGDIVTPALSWESSILTTPDVVGLCDSSAPADHRSSAFADISTLSWRYMQPASVDAFADLWKHLPHIFVDSFTVCSYVHKSTRDIQPLSHAGLIDTWITAPKECQSSAIADACTTSGGHMPPARVSAPAASREHTLFASVDCTATSVELVLLGSENVFANLGGCLQRELVETFAIPSEEMSVTTVDYFAASGWRPSQIVVNVTATPEKCRLRASTHTFAESGGLERFATAYASSSRRSDVDSLTRDSAVFTPMLSIAYVDNSTDSGGHFQRTSVGALTSLRRFQQPTFTHSVATSERNTFTSPITASTSTTTTATFTRPTSTPPAPTSSCVSSSVCLEEVDEVARNFKIESSLSVLSSSSSSSSSMSVRSIRMDDQAAELDTRTGVAGRGLDGRCRSQTVEITWKSKLNPLPDRSRALAFVVEQVRRHSQDVQCKSISQSLLAQYFVFTYFMHGYVGDEVPTDISSAYKAKRREFIGTFVSEDLTHNVSSAHRNTSRTSISCDGRVKQYSPNYANWNTDIWLLHGCDLRGEVQTETSFWDHYVMDLGPRFRTKFAEKVDESALEYRCGCARADVAKGMIALLGDILISQPQSSAISETFCVANLGADIFARPNTETELVFTCVHGNRGANTEVACVFRIKQRANAFSPDLEVFTGDTSARSGNVADAEDYGLHTTQNQFFLGDLCAGFGQTRFPFPETIDVPDVEATSSAIEGTTYIMRVEGLNFAFNITDACTLGEPPRSCNTLQATVKIQIGFCGHVQFATADFEVAASLGRLFSSTYYPSGFALPTIHHERGPLQRTYSLTGQPSDWDGLIRKVIGWIKGRSANDYLSRNCFECIRARRSDFDKITRYSDFEVYPTTRHQLRLYHNVTSRDYDHKDHRLPAVLHVHSDGMCSVSEVQMSTPGFTNECCRRTSSTSSKDFYHVVGDNLPVLCVSVGDGARMTQGHLHSSTIADQTKYLRYVFIAGHSATEAAASSTAAREHENRGANVDSQCFMSNFQTCTSGCKKWHFNGEVLLLSEDSCVVDFDSLLALCAYSGDKERLKQDRRSPALFAVSTVLAMNPKCEIIHHPQLLLVQKEKLSLWQVRPWRPHGVCYRLSTLHVHHRCSLKWRSIPDIESSQRWRMRP